MAAEWEVEVIERVRAGEDADTALAEVINLYLDAGKPIALVGAIYNALNRGDHIPALIRPRIAALFENEPKSNEPIRTIFAFIHPPQQGLRANELRDLFWDGYDALVEGRDPGLAFWRALAEGLMAGHPEMGLCLLYPAPIEMRLRSRKPARGRPLEPERATKHKTLANLTAQKIAQGVPRKAAAYKVLEDLKRQAKEENWQGNLPSEETIRKAYERSKRQR
jgi:hypothetical protein